MIRSLRIFIIAATLLSASQASIIFTNLGPGKSYDVTQGNPVGNDFAGDNAAQGDTFTPTVTATLTSIELALSCVVSCPAPESFTVAITKSSADAPAAVIESFSFNGITLGGLGNNNPLLTAPSALHPVLTAGTQYWITVSSSVSFAIAWNDNSTGDPSDQAISSDGGVTWFSPSGMTPSAYEVDGTTSSGVPEPSTTVLFGSAVLFGLFALRRPAAK
jgi:hypothetical protein